MKKLPALLFCLMPSVFNASDMLFVVDFEQSLQEEIKVYCDQICDRFDHECTRRLDLRSQRITRLKNLVVQLQNQKNKQFVQKSFRQPDHLKERDVAQNLRVSMQSYLVN